MTPLRNRHIALLAFCAALPGSPAIAAESYDSCTGFIDSVPATLTTQGTWCLRQDLSTAIASGAAITVAANNVTVDCNGFKLGGLAAGDASLASGIRATDRHNATVRHCGIRGFHYGVMLSGGGGHLVEDNRLDNNLLTGIRVTAPNSLVQRNRVYDTGGASDRDSATGIYGSADAIGNVVSGVFAVRGPSLTRGIVLADGPGAAIRDNRVTALQVVGGGFAVGIELFAPLVRVSGNHVVNHPASAGSAIAGGNDAVGFCAQNTVGGFNQGLVSCQDAGGNAVR